MRTAVEEHRVGGKSYCVFETPLGPCGVAWRKDATPQKRVLVCAFQLPESTAGETEARLAQRSGGRRTTKPPPPLRPLVESVRQHLDGYIQDFRKVRLDFEGMPDFAREVYTVARAIPAGETMTYGDIAKAVGQPGAARAVGQAMGSNPIPLIVPCHRVLAAGDKKGGFSAHGGAMTKLRMLALEGVTLGPQPTIESSADLRRATKALRERDPVLARIMTTPIAFETKRDQSPYQTLMEAVASQQLSPKAAATILDRVKALYLLSEFPTPEDLVSTPDELLRGAGLSGAKTKALKDLATKTLDGTVPPYKELKKLSNETIVRRLTGIYGIGRWTVEMMLIFNLGRQDVLALDDYALRRSTGIVYGLPDTPSPKAFFDLGQRWRPYRTVASLYLWKALETKSE